MATTKVQSEGINLADDFTFTGTVAGTPTNTPAFLAYNNSADTISNSSYTKVEFDTEVYDLGSVWGRNYLIGTVPTEGVSLVSTSHNSSLGHMCRYFAPTMRQCFIPELGVLHDDAFEALRSATTPQFIPATAFAMASLLKDVTLDTNPIQLPQGSVIMITGGFKGRTQEIPEEILKARLRHLFPTASIVGEYGMTELSSQMWSSTLESRFCAPPWLKVVAVDPQTGQALPNGSLGQLKFIDLANHQTVIGIETRDQGIVHEDGSMELLGRLPKSDARGCSLSVEEVDAFFVNQTPVTSETSATEKTLIEHQRPPKTETVLKVIETLKNLSTETIQNISEGLSTDNALWGWQQSLRNLSDQARFDIMLNNQFRPATITIVLARGVFTSGLEWVALALASGASVHVKVPTNNLSNATVWLRAFQEYDLPLTFSTNRDLPASDLLWLFGDDQTLTEIQQQTPHAKAQTYGHRFSIALCSDNQSDARQVAQDIVAYDTRGCMAPVAVFCQGDTQRFATHLFQALRELEQVRPLGTVDPFLGPEIRRRVGLAIQQEGHTWLEQDGKRVWGVLALPRTHFTPSALPRLISVHSVSSPAELTSTLRDWAPKLSTIGVSAGLDVQTWLGDLDIGGARICDLGTMQTPPFGRLHDGVPMWSDEV